MQITRKYTAHLTRNGHRPFNAALAIECDLYNYINEKQHDHARQTAQILEYDGKPFKSPSYYSLKKDFLRFCFILRGSSAFAKLAG